MKSNTFLWGKKSKVNKGGKGIAFNDPKIKFVTKYTKQKNVLDLGCVQHNPENYKSPYWLHKAIAKTCNKLVGLDLYEEGVSFLNTEGFNVIHADAEKFLIDEKFDVIVAGDLIEHLSNPGKMLETSIRHLEDNGFIVIVTPNPWYWRFAIKALLFSSARPNPEHTCWFCLDTLNHLLSRYGLEIVESEFATVQYGYSTRKIIDFLLPLPKLLKYNSIHICAYKTQAE